MDHFAEAAARLSDVTDDALSRVSQLTFRLQVSERRVERLENDLKLAKEELRQVQEIDLPALLHEFNLSEIKLKDGSKVSISSFITATIPKEKQEAAFEWLRENGYGDLVKNVVSVTFGRQEDDRAVELAGVLVKHGLRPLQKQWVEPMTLKAFAKESDEKGTPLPDELFGVYRGYKAKITKGK